MRQLMLVLVAVAVAITAPVSPGQAEGKRPLTHDDYDGWKSMRGQSISDDGRWLMTTVSPAVGDGELIVRSTTGDTVYRHERGTGARFSADSKWVVFTIAASRAETLAADMKRLKGGSSSRGGSGAGGRGRGGAGGRPGGRPGGARGARGGADRPKTRMAIMNLADGSVEVIEKVKGFRVPGEGPAVVVYHLEKPEPANKEEDAGKEGEEKSEGKEKSEKGEKSGEAEGAAAGEGEQRPRRGGRGGRGGGRRGARGGRGGRGGGRGRAPGGDSEDDGKSWLKDGTPLIVRHLGTDKSQRIEGVMSYGITSKKAVLWFACNGKKDDPKIVRGLHTLELSSGKRTTLIEGAANFGGISTDREVTRMAFTSDRRDREAEKPAQDIYTWKVGEPGPAKRIISSDTPGFPAGRVLAASRGGGGGAPRGRGRRGRGGRGGGGGGGGLTFSRDGQVLLFGAAAAPKPDMPKLLDEETVKLDLWHWKDPLLQPMQAKRRGGGQLRCAWHFDQGSLTVLSKTEIESVSFLTPCGARALVQDSAPYAQQVSWDGRYTDVYVVNTVSGDRTPILRALRGRAQNSPNGNVVATFRHDQWYVLDVVSGVERCLTKQVDVSFAVEDHDTPDPARAYGIAGWSEDGKSVFINDRFDLWMFALDGSKVTCVTDGWGRRNSISLRYTSLDREQRFIPTDSPLLFAATNDVTKGTGYYTDRVGTLGKPEKIIMLDKRFGGLAKAKNDDRMIFTLSTFAECGNAWTATPGFRDMKQLTDINPQQKDVRWGNAEIVNWHNADGVALQGFLVKPEGFDPKKKYPMMVYFYEKTSQNVHRYVRPAPGTSPNAAYYVSNGYLWFQPDIVYRDGYPGESALKCVASGVQSLIAKGFVDEKAIGAAGHSWGGYQTAYLVTRTNIFKCVESGAPVSNMTSAYGGIRWGSGMSRAFQYEKTQSRIGGSLWRYPLRYLENSPIFSADKVETPVLMLHNDEDGAVPWYQGIEFFCALRRLNREVYMFNYVGQGHGLSRRADQRDWTKRMQQYFDHHLKGAPMPPWMAEGVAFKDREREKLEFSPPKHPVWPEKKNSKPAETEAPVPSGSGASKQR